MSLSPQPTTPLRSFFSVWGRPWGPVGLAVGLLPFAFCSWYAAHLNAAAARRMAEGVKVIGDQIADLSTDVPPTPLPPTPESHDLALLDGDDPSALPHEPAATASLRRPSATECNEPSQACGFPAPIGVFVSRHRVIAAAEAGMRPSGSPVPATAWRPAGLSLSGVGGLGVGLRDGDILVNGGGPATSEGAVVGAVIGALRHRAKAMSGVAWRGRQRILITVELPELVKVDSRQEPRQTARP